MMKRLFSAVFATTLFFATLPAPSHASNGSTVGAPVITAISLHDVKCRFMVIVEYPVNSPPDAGSQLMQLQSPAGNLAGGIAYLNLTGQGTAQSTRTILSGEHLVDDLQPGGAWLDTGDANFNGQFCHRETTIQISYSSNGISSDIGSLTGFTPTPAAPTKLVGTKVINDPEYCDLYVDFGIAAEVDTDVVAGRMATIIYEEPGLEATFLIANPSRNDFFVYRFATQQIIEAETYVSSYVSNTSIPGCSGSGFLSISYTSLGIEKFSGYEVVGLSPCGRGTFSPTGYQLGMITCEPAPIGSYVSSAASTEATICPDGATTTEIGSASANDCIGTTAEIFNIFYSSGTGTAPISPTFIGNNESFEVPGNFFTRDGYLFAGWSDGRNTYQPGQMYTNIHGHITLSAQWRAISSVKKISALKSLKSKSTTLIPTRSDQGQQLFVKSSGACSTKIATLKGTRWYKLVANAKAGTCVLKITAAATDQVASLSKTIRIKVSKSGN